jgi:hypothetical protein
VSVLSFPSVKKAASYSHHYFLRLAATHPIYSPPLTEPTQAIEKDKMRKLSTLAGMTLFALAATASAQEAAPAAGTTAPAPAAAVAAATPAPVQPEGARRKIQVGLSFLPMGMGKYTFSDTYTTTASSEAYFAYGFGLSAGYELLPGLVVGIAPQVIFNVQPKPLEAANPAVAREYDLMVRVAYGLKVADIISVYAEVLPGYSRISPSDDASPSDGLVVAFGVGCAVDMTDRFFVSVGGGYQMGFQSQTEGVHQMQLRTKYVRVAMGGGVRF